MRRPSRETRNIEYSPGPQHLTERVPCSVEPGKLYNLQFRAEAFNMPNHPVEDRPAFSNLGDTAWGKITGLATQMRQIQFALKLLFSCGARFSMLARTSVRAPT